MTKASYNDHAFTDFEGEKKRLHLQATSFLQQEIGLLQQHGLQNCQQILDIGCGQGELAALIASMPDEYQVHAIDNNEEFIRTNTANYSPQHNLQFFRQDLLSPLPASYDLAYARFVFQHLSNPAAALQHIQQALHPGGRLVIIDICDEWISMYPSIPPLQELIDKSIFIQENNAGNRLIAQQLPSLMKECGYTDIRLDLIPITTEQLGMDAFFNMIFSYRANFTSPDGRNLETLYTEAKAMAASLRHFFCFTLVCCISGKKE